MNIQRTTGHAPHQRRGLAAFRRWSATALVPLLLSAGVVAASGSQARAQPRQPSWTVPVFARPTGYWLSPPTYSGQLYGPTSPEANWNVEQWGIPTSQLPPFRAGVTANQAAGAIVTRNRVLLDQTTAQLSCGTTAPPEFDLFAAPNINPTYPGYPSAALNVSPSANLAAMKAISFGITLRPSALHALGSPCESPATAGINQGVMMGAVILTDPLAGQTFFYQIQLAVYRLQDGVTTTSMPSFFFFTGAGGQWGYDDDATVYGQPQATVGTSTTYHFELQPRLEQIIKQGQAYGMDQNLADWSINGAYYGNSAWGHVVTAAQWQNFSLTVTPSGS